MAEGLKKEYGLKGDFTLDTIFNLRDIITYEDNNSIPEETLFETLESLLEKLNEERAKEGAAILKNFLIRLENIAGFWTK